MKTFLIVGLGNPGHPYEHTRHNIGFRVLDAFADKLGSKFEFEKKFNSEIAEITPSRSPLHKGENPPLKIRGVILVKPQTFMNESGEAVKKLTTYYKLPATNLLVVHDEIDLPFGKIKLYGTGGSAGHKGVNSIIQILGYSFLRLRIGIENRAQYRIPATDAYVLQNFTAEENELLAKKIIPETVSEIEKFLQ